MIFFINVTQFKLIQKIHYKARNKDQNKDQNMKPSKQLSFYKDPRKGTKIWWIKKQTTYGGSFDYRKVERPFDSKKLVHVVLKQIWEKGSILQSRRKVLGIS